MKSVPLGKEIYAQALLLSITRHLAAGAARLCRVPFETVSTKGALLSVASHLTAIALGSLDAPVVIRLLERIAASRVLKRPGRSDPLRSFTPQRLWGPNGRRRRQEHRRLT